MESQRLTADEASQADIPEASYQPASGLTSAGNAAAQTMTDQAAALNLHNTIQYMTNAELRSTANKEIKQLIELLDQQQKNMDQQKKL